LALRNGAKNSIAGHHLQQPINLSEGAPIDRPVLYSVSQLEAYINPKITLHANAILSALPAREKMRSIISLIFLVEKNIAMIVSPKVCPGRGRKPLEPSHYLAAVEMSSEILSVSCEPPSMQRVVASKPLHHSSESQ